MSIVSRRHFLMSSAAPLLARKKEAQPKQPNIVLILADDLAAWMCGCYGQREIHTPNIDLLARLGVRLLNAFVVVPADSANRATILTGRTPMQHGIRDHLTSSPGENPPRGQAAPPPWFTDEVMISDVLAGRGYDCGYFGKWDLGRPEIPGHGFASSYTVGGDAPYQDPAVYRNGEIVKETGYLTELITAAASGYLDRQAAGKPFFMTVSYPNPHVPLDGHPQKYYDRYADSQFERIGWRPLAENAFQGKEYMADPVANIRKFAASISALDDQVKALFNKLRDTKLWSDTLIVFTSENGHTLGRHGLWGAGYGSNPPNMYDDVVQVPLIASWPGETPIESTLPIMISSYDLMPTILEAAGAAAPPGRKLPGRSFFHQLVRKPAPAEEPPWPATVFAAYHDTLMARDNRFKVVVRDGGEGPNEFYRTRQDPRELRNEYDNPLVVTVRDRMREQAEQWAETYSP